MASAPWGYDTMALMRTSCQWQTWVESIMKLLFKLNSVTAAELLHNNLVLILQHQRGRGRRLCVLQTTLVCIVSPRPGQLGLQSKGHSTYVSNSETMARQLLANIIDYINRHLKMLLDTRLISEAMRKTIPKTSSRLSPLLAVSTSLFTDISQRITSTRLKARLWPRSARTQSL